MATKGKLILSRGSEKFETTAKLWAEALLKAGDFGWKPEKPQLNYYASGAVISNDDASAIYDSLQKLFDAALKDPMSVYPVRFDMGEMYDLKEVYF